MKSRMPTLSLLAAALPAAAVEPLNRYTSITTHTIDVSEASGVGYNWDTKTLFTIGDEATALVELSKTGTTLGSMDFDYNRTPREARAIDDAEGVAYLGNNTFMISDERRNQGVVTLYGKGAFRTLQDLAPTTYAFGPYDGNTGLEGVCHDPIDNAFWGVKESGPVRIYKMTGVTTGSPVVTQPIITKYISRLQRLSEKWSRCNGSEHPPRHRKIDQCSGVLDFDLMVADQAAGLDQPAEGPFDHPASR